MTETKTRRPTKRQLGQYMTPSPLAERLVKHLPLSQHTRVLEPGFGDGSFILALIEAFLPLYEGPVPERLEMILTQNIFGVEVDPLLYRQCLDKIRKTWGHLPATHQLVCADFFQHDFSLWPAGAAAFGQSIFSPSLKFDCIVGNPPFGGTIDPKLQDELDRRYGFRNGDKIKKETYAFFLVKCLEHLQPGGRLLFICSDTFMTIPTMRGLRRLLMEQGAVSIQSLEAFSEETSYPMVLLEVVRSGRSEVVTLNQQSIRRETMELTGNFSWAISDETSPYFAGPKISQYVVCSSGMTIGRYDLFVSEINDGCIVEPYDFAFFDEPITLARELERARLHHLSPQMRQKIRLQEQAGEHRRNVRVVEKATPEYIYLPHPDYRFYNKASGDIIYSPPTHAVFWKDEGDAVLTFKKNGNWYLHGVGGKPYFGRPGLTWQLIAARLNMRYLPPGYILDSGAPCAFLHPGGEEAELYFILGWTCTELCTRLLKTVINHTKNIQSKDIERLPYPFWVPQQEKERAIAVVRALIERAIAGIPVSRMNPEIGELERLFAYQYVPVRDPTRYQQEQPSGGKQLSLWEE
jgi:hypothetical protein